MRAMGEHGMGTIVRTTTPQGRPRLRVVVTMADGRRVWRTVKSQREAERVRRQLVEMREMELDPTRQTLAAYLRSWLAGLASAHNARVRPRTLDHYRLAVESHIIPGHADPEHEGKRVEELGKLKLSAVTAGRIQRWVDADPGAPQTVRHHHAVLRRALNVAVRQRLLAYNPANAVELPEAEGDKARPMTAGEARRIVETSAALDADGKPVDPLGVLWRLALVTGLRQGELLGLSWDDVGPSSVTVRAQLQRRVTDAERELARAQGRKPRGSWALTEPKAARKVTSVAIDAATSEALEAHRRRQAKIRTTSWRYFGLVFSNAGEPLHGAEVLKAWKAACKRAGVAERRFHDLRGTSATLMREAGVAEDTRMARLGHSTTEMARHYARASEAQDQDAAERLGRALRGAS